MLSLNILAVLVPHKANTPVWLRWHTLGISGLAVVDFIIVVCELWVDCVLYIDAGFRCTDSA